MSWRLCFIILLPLALLAEEPWGMDADLAYPCAVSEAASPQGMISRMGQTCIRFHQNVISPVQGPRSGYVPSSSHYTLNAMRKYGFVWGVLYGCDRLMRENNDPWVYSRCVNDEGFNLKWDPVR